MTSPRLTGIFPAALVCIATSLTPLATLAAREGKLSVCTTVPDLGELARVVGRDAVDVTVLTKGPQDPHSIEPRPTHVRALHDADVFIQIGLELEVGWAPTLLRTARNPDILAGGRGHLDASHAIRPLQVPEGPVTRAAGDVHALGNPHYLLDPLNGLRVASRIAEKLSELRPDRKPEFGARLSAFRRQVAVSLLGEKLVTRYAGDELRKLLELLERGGSEHFVAFLKKQEQESLLGGWLGALWPYRGTRFVADHDTWPYLTKLFSLEVVAFLEPRPGLSPTTRHLTEVVQKARQLDVAGVLSCVYFDDRHAEFVSDKSEIPVVPLAHQSGARPGIDGYLDVFDYNTRKLLDALRKRGGKAES